MVAQLLMTVAGGLGLFILGMNMMSEGLQRVAGDRMRRILELLTFNRYIAVVTGVIITVLVQSSSATTVMVVSFVNAGLMTLTQAVGTIFGANIGTTITAQMVAYNIGEIALPAVAAGVIMTLFVKRRVYRNVGQTVLGFGLLFLGISIMGSRLETLQDYPAILNMLESFGQNRLLGILAGMLFTALVQSSSASTAAAIVLVSQGVLGLDGAMAIIMGSNVGTCITSVLSTIGTNLNARRAGLAHVMFNLLGVGIFLIIFTPFTALVELTSNEVARQVAWGHTIFNVSNTLLFLPFVSWLVNLIKLIVPGEEEVLEMGPKFLDRRMLATPSLALGAAEREIERMAGLALEMVDTAFVMLEKGDMKYLKKIEQKEDLVDELEKEITVYLADSSQHNINRDQGRLVAGYLHAVNDVERIGDHAENIAKLLKQKIEDNYPFSESAVEELHEMHAKVRKMTAKAIEAYRTKDLVMAREVLIDDNEVDRMEKKLRQRHVGRINDGRCFPTSGVLYLDIVANLERIGDHATNIAQVVLGDF